MLGKIFSILIYQPLYNALVVLYDIIPDLGVAIVLLTILIRFLLLPLAKKSIESQKKLQDIEPEIKKLKEKYKNDQQKQGAELMALYKKNGINPAAGCLPLIIQMIFLIALYRVFMAGLASNGGGEMIYSFIKNPGVFTHISLGFLDLSKPNYILAVLAAASQYWQTKMIMASRKVPDQKTQDSKEGEEDFSAIFQKQMNFQMLYFMPLITLFFGIRFPSGLIIYWLTTTVFMIIQQYFVLSKKDSAK